MMSLIFRLTRHGPASYQPHETSPVELPVVLQRQCQYLHNLLFSHLNSILQLILSSNASKPSKMPAPEDPKMPSSFEGNEEFYETSRTTKLFRRIKDEPLIPLGMALTCWALYRASRSIRAGNDRDYTNKMFRRRIYAQAFTVAAMVGGSYYYADEHRARKNLETKVAEQKAKEKNRAWIKELEAREDERLELERIAREEAKK
ncbi:Respiratory supercomplex factor 1, mitochondrial [Arthrobotrys conoides]|uniref:Respiratory supercomplex factor 1, mitochondrial n=1 Tax=Arthrobotrys conoides TaxID=74498 RepID=A0AAN8RYK9_9PEZI